MTIVALSLWTSCLLSLRGSLFRTVNYSNQLVPISGKGIVSELLGQYANQFDFYSDGVNTFGRGNCLDQWTCG